MLKSFEKFDMSLLQENHYKNVRPTKTPTLTRVNKFLDGLVTKVPPHLLSKSMTAIIPYQEVDDEYHHDIISARETN